MNEVKIDLLSSQYSSPPTRTHSCQLSAVESTYFRPLTDRWRLIYSVIFCYRPHLCGFGRLGTATQALRVLQYRVTTRRGFCVLITNNSTAFVNTHCLSFDLPQTLDSVLYAVHFSSPVFILESIISHIKKSETVAVPILLVCTQNHIRRLHFIQTSFYSHWF